MIHYHKTIFFYNCHSMDKQTRIIVIKLQFLIKIKHLRVLNTYVCSCLRNNRIIINHKINIMS